jgi:hypothetical protein
LGTGGLSFRDFAINEIHRIYSAIALLTLEAESVLRCANKDIRIFGKFWLHFAQKTSVLGKY